MYPSFVFSLPPMTQKITAFHFFFGIPIIHSHFIHCWWDVSSAESPLVARTRGRPKGAQNNSTRRDPSAFELAEVQSQKKRRCRLCRAVGHNSRSCPKLADEDIQRFFVFRDCCALHSNDYLSMRLKSINVAFHDLYRSQEVPPF